MQVQDRATPLVPAGCNDILARWFLQWSDSNFANRRLIDTAPGHPAPKNRSDIPHE